MDIDGIFVANAGITKANSGIVSVQGPHWRTYNLVIGSTGTPPTLGTTTVNLASWRPVGDSIEIMYTLVMTGAGSAGSFPYLYPPPAGYTINSSVVDISTENQAYTARGVLGTAAYGSSIGGGGGRLGYVRAYNSTNLVIEVFIESSVTFNMTTITLGGATQEISFRATVPVNELTA